MRIFLLILENQLDFLQVESIIWSLAVQVLEICPYQPERAPIPGNPFRGNLRLVSSSAFIICGCPAGFFMDLLPGSPWGFGYPETQVAGLTEPHPLRRAAHSPVRHQVKPQRCVIDHARVPGIRVDLCINPTGWEGMDSCALLDIFLPNRTTCV